MLYTLKNPDMTITIDTHGAELHSINRGGLEYLWQAGEPWKRHAPILFPFICSTGTGSYRAGGAEYRMKSNHGFARDMEFSVNWEKEDGISMSLESDESTLAQYPYPFRLTVEYTLLKDGVRVLHRVVNTGETSMYFYLGGHPAFRCPLLPEERFEDYVVEYEKPEHVTRDVNGTPETVLDNGTILPVTRELFDYDSLVLPQPHSDTVTLRSRHSEHAVTVEFPDAKCITVWSPTADDRAEFVCLEPWTDVPVYFDDAFPDIEKKPHAVRLVGGESYAYGYVIRVK